MPASIKPTKVVFLHEGTETGMWPLTDSHSDFLIDERNFTDGRRPTEALVYGPVGGQVTFFSDRQYRIGHNALLVSLKRDATEADPVRVEMAVDRLGPGDHENGVYRSDNWLQGAEQQDDFGWILYKSPLGGWATEVLKAAGTFAQRRDGVLTIAGGVGLVEGVRWVEYRVQGRKRIDHLAHLTDKPGWSDRSGVDNISSVLFGALEG